MVRKKERERVKERKKKRKTERKKEGVEGERERVRVLSELCWLEQRGDSWRGSLAVYEAVS